MNLALEVLQQGRTQGREDGAARSSGLKIGKALYGTTAISVTLGKRERGAERGSREANSAVYSREVVKNFN